MNADRSVLAVVERVIRRLVLPVAQVLLWLFLFLSLLLGGWVGIGWAVGHWTPVVVTSGSMAPTLKVGDVILVDSDGSDIAKIGQRAVIVYQRPDGDLVAHRVLSVEEGGFVTKGDANEAPDSDVVPVEAVVGDTRLVVPLIGQPAVWADRGDLVPLVAWLVLSTAAIAHVFVLALGRVRRRRARAGAPGEQAMPVDSQGVRRVRGLVAFLLVAYYALDPSRFAMLEGKGNGLVTMILALSMVLGTNALGTVLRLTRRNPRFLPAVELTLDTVLVVMLATLTGASGIGWLLFALPIIEAAVRFRLAGALLHWMALTAVVLTARIWVSELTGSSNVLGELQAVLDQLSVLFLVVVPGAHLAEQLIGDIAVQQRATGRAVDRGRLLQQVAEAGREAPKVPVVFNKQATCVNRPGGAVIIPSPAPDMVDYEGELGVVIGRTAKRVSAADALDYVAGYLIVNDVSVRDWQRRSATMTMGKPWDTHGPIGPWLTTADEIPDPQALSIRTWLNDELRQDGNTTNMIFPVATLIEHLSTACTLLPGTVIATGTPEGVGMAMTPPGFMKAGDTVRVEITGLGTLQNPVVADPA